MKRNNMPQDSQFVMSFELLQLLKWLLENEQDSLKKIISNAIKNGLYQELKNSNLASTDEGFLQQGIVDFFALLEALLYESIDENEFNKISHRALIPYLDNVDTALLNSEDLQLSIEKATSSKTAQSKEEVKNIFCKELLKRWRPDKKFAKN